MRTRGLFLLLLLPFAGIAQDKLTINGKVKGLIETSKVVLVNANEPTDTVGVATVKKNGMFVLKAKLKEPVLGKLYLNEIRAITVFFGNSNVAVTGDIAAMPKIKITGSTLHNDFVAYEKIFNPYFERMVRINQELRGGYAENSTELIEAFHKLADSVQHSADVFINGHTNSPVSALMLVAISPIDDNVLLTESRLNLITASAKDNVFGKYMLDYVAENKPTAIGVVAQDFVQADTSGNPVSLSSFRGKYVLVDFWASWCGPCRQENPNVVTTFNKFKQKNFTVLGVSLDRQGQKDKWLQAIHTDSLTWTHVSDLQFWNNAVAVQYKVQSIPQNFLIGPDGKIIAKNLRGPALEAKLCEVLGCN